MSRVAEFVNTDQHHSKLREINAKHRIEKALEKAASNLKWYNEHHDDIQRTLGTSRSSSLMASLGLIVLGAILKQLLV